MTSRFVDLSLFYFVRNGTQDGYVLWGEGLVRSTPGHTTSVRSENLAEGLRVLRVACDFEAAVTTLTAAIFPYTRGGLVNIHLGLVQRPPTMAVAPYANLETRSAALLHQFVREQKADALWSGGDPPTPEGREELERLLARLETFVPFAFRGENAARVGDVVLLEEQSLAAAPVSFTTVRRNGAPPEAVLVTVEAPARMSALDINVRVMGSDDAVLDDVLVRWEPGRDPTFEVATNQRFGAVEMRVWRAGHLVWSTDTPFILELGLNMHLMGRTIVLNDRLTDLLRGAIRAGAAPASALLPVQTVRQDSGSQSVVGANLREPWRQAFLGARAEVFGFARPPVPAAEYFPQGGGGRAAAILAFLKLLGEGRSFLVDPFFDEVGAADLLPRISGDVDLTIITSLPDDGSHPQQRLVAYLNEAQGFLPRGVKIRRVTRAASTEQAFHDRYLIVMGGEGPPRGFLLSNSFSGLARKYPMVAAEMSTGTTGAVLDDIERLLRNKNIETLWPPPPPGPFIHDAFGVGWRWYLARLVPRLRRASADWLAAAGAAGWLGTDTDGQPRWGTQQATAVVDRILPRRPARSRIRRQTSRGHGRQRRVVGPSIGFRVGALGERVARGLEVSARDIAKRLGQSAVRELVEWLRSSFRPPSTWERSVHWVTRMGIHQALRDEVVTRERVRQGMAFWSDTDTAMTITHEYGRDFTYRVLLLLQPQTAFALGVELGDPSLLVAALDWWQPEAWKLEVSTAALASSSTMVRVLGAQSLAAPDARGDFSPLPEPPESAVVPALLAALDNVEPTALALVLLEWALRTTDDVARRQLVDAAMARLPQLPPGLLREAADVVVGNASLFATLVESATNSPPAVFTSVANATLAATARVLAAEESEQVWSSLVDCSGPLAALILLGSQGRYDAARARVESLLDTASANRKAVMVSPFRRHPEWRKATGLLALGQILLMQVRELAGADVDIDVGIAWSWVADASPRLFQALMRMVGRR